MKEGTSCISVFLRARRAGKEQIDTRGDNFEGKSWETAKPTGKISTSGVFC